MEPFTIIANPSSSSSSSSSFHGEEETTQRPIHHLFDDFRTLESAKSADHDVQYASALREANPGLIVTGCPQSNVPLRAFAAAGFASCERDLDTDSFWAWTGYVATSIRGKQGALAENPWFAKYHYNWSGEDFIMYIVGNVQYILKEKRDDEHILGPSRSTEALLKTAGDWLLGDDNVVWVFDNYWRRSKELYEEVLKASWDKVILDEKMKKDLTGVTNKFFDSKEVYDDLGVPWKRGLLFHGPPGNGKTISIKALMHTLLSRDHPIPTLYVKQAPGPYYISLVFQFARRMSPCMLVLEDIETIVTNTTRSYFFNEMDGLENNDGLFVVGSTNFLDRLDPGLSKRPSRFDRKYLFPLPNEHERTLYCEFWRNKLRDNPIEFPKKLCVEMARITPGFSFAFLQECFVATLLIIARKDTGAAGSDDDLDDYELWRVFKEQADTLRKEINEGNHKDEPRPVDWDRQPEKTDGWMGLASNGEQHEGRRQPQDCRCARGATEHQCWSLVEPLYGLRVEDKVRLSLPYNASKINLVNTAAFQARLP